MCAGRHKGIGMGKKEGLRGKFERIRGTLGLYHEAKSQEEGDGLGEGAFMGVH